MKHTLTLILALFVALVLAACGTASTTPTGGSTDAQAAGTYLPTVAGYTVTPADSISDAISAAAGQGAEALGNPLIQQVVNRVDNFISCYQDVGAVAANIYTQVDLGSVLSGNVVPGVGAVAVVNQDRVRENLLACAVQAQGDAPDFAAQSAPTICQGSGNFVVADNTFTYVYISTQADFCDSVTEHFSAVQ